MGRIRQSITRHQATVLHFVETYAEKNGCAPTLEEIGAYFEVTRQAAKVVVDTLVRKGFLRRTTDKNRNLIVGKIPEFEEWIKRE